MNDKTEDEAIREIFSEFDHNGESSEISTELVDALEQADGSEVSTYPEEFEMGFDDQDGDDTLLSDKPGFDDNPLAGLFDDTDSEEIPDVGFNKAAVFWGLLLVATIAAFAYNAVKNTRQAQGISLLGNAALEVESGIGDIAYQALRAINGRDEPFDQLPALSDQVSDNLNVLNTGAKMPLSPEAADGLARANEIWSTLSPQVELVVGNRGVIRNTRSQVDAVNELTPRLLSNTDNLVDKLIENEASLTLINVASRQRFLSQRIKASANEFATGVEGWNQAVSQFRDDVTLFGEVNADIRSMGGFAIADDISQLEQPYEQLVSSSEGILGNMDSYAVVLNAADEIENRSLEMRQIMADVSGGIGQQENKPGWQRNLPLILAGLGLLALVGLVFSLQRHSRRREETNSQRTKKAEDAVIKLLDEMGDLAQGDLTVEAEVTNEVTGAIADSVNFAIGEMRILVNGIKAASNEMSNTTENSEQLIAQLLTSSDAQSEEILNAAQDIERMSETMDRMSQKASQSSERAIVAAQSAKVGATAVRDTIVGMNSTRNQIQDTAKRLKRLGESSQQINEIVNLIQDVTEQTNVLSLNASIQAAMAGEAGRGFAVVAEEVQRLAERSARASSDITELVKTIQQDANSAIQSMETTTEEVVAGARIADQAGQALDEIEQISQELLSTVQNLASEATTESRLAKSVTDRMDKLKSATEESDLSVSQVAASLGQIREEVSKLDKSVAGFRLPA